MYLKNIKINGFKSFADKIDLEIDQGITGVVGPNGSGKSNIVDAIKWVLGEQSVKALRGDNTMTDVIFTGSNSRKASKRAVVSLVFDNSDHYLQSEFSEIEIKRVVYDTGENEYYINNIKSRLKDITDLFLDSGAGKESFNIISQGAVADIINSKPDDRRVIFEEAAGVLKYKKRKDESFRKLQKTNENIARVDLLIDEILNTLTPLKEQAEVAKKYLDYKDSLTSIEIALMARDIGDINEEYKIVKSNVERLSNEIEDFALNNNKDYSKIDKLKLDSLKLDEEIEEKNTKVLELVNKISELQSNKQITIERQKYKVDDTKLQSNIIALKEELLTIQNNIDGVNKDISLLCSSIEKDKLAGLEIKNIKEEKEEKRNKLLNTISNLNKDIMTTNNRIDILKDNMVNDTKIPNSVKSVLNNVRLRGIHNVLGKLIEVEEKYSLAIEVALGFNTNVIVCDDEKCAKEAIIYLKDNKLGRVTFFPMSNIKARFIEQSILDTIKKENGFVGIAAELVKYNSEYKDIIYNQLGNVLIVKDIDSLNKIGKLINYKYKVVSLDGEVLNAGGAITGGTLKNNSSLLNQRFEIQRLEEERDEKSKKLMSYELDLNKIETEYNDVLLKVEKNEKNLIVLNEQLKQKQDYLSLLNNNYKNKDAELNGTKSVSNKSLDKELDKILKDFYNAQAEKEKLEKELNKLKDERSDMALEIADMEREFREVNSIMNQKQNELKNEEIKAGKMDVKLDNLLLSLNENYGLTFERARDEYSLDVDVEVARVNVNNLKVKIRELGEVNTGSISEYERLNERYNFLTSQKEDLEKSVTELMSIIDEMDEIMKVKFVESFEKIKEEFNNVFKTLFKGGEGLLSLTNPDDLLNTGVDILAVPPGKKLNSIALLSGGEKTLTAIALLFAILNVKPVPFVVLDEVEAALDENNVDSFGRYLQSKKDKSQFIIITHKKRTMEFADTLYGVTMQESGVSKLVSVRLEDK